MHLYGDPGLRQSRDLDLMVKPEDLDRTDRLLLDEGYHRTFPDLELSTRQMEVLQSACQHYSYSHPQRSILLELHWRLNLWTPEQVAELWSRSRPMEWSGARFRHMNHYGELLPIERSPGPGMPCYPLRALARRTIRISSEEHTWSIMSTLTPGVVGVSVVGPKVALALKEMNR
jgi:hypothetical protein